MTENKTGGREKKRIDYIDIMKGIGILSVIAGHFGDDLIERVVFTYHLPLFFLISGYFMSVKKEFSLYRREKAKQLIPPYIFTCICVCVISVINNGYYHTPDRIAPDIFYWIYASLYGAGGDFTVPFYIKGIGAIWFLLATLEALLIVRFFLDKKWGWIYVLILAYLACVSSQYIWLPFSIQAGAVAAVFVYIGYLLRKVDFLNKKFSIAMFLFSVGVFVFEIYFHIAPYMYKNYYPNGAFCIINAVIICYLILYVSKFISAKCHILNRLLRFWGENSMIIMCVHLMELNTFLWFSAWGTFQTMEGMQRWGAYFVTFAGKLLVYSLFVLIVHRVSWLKRIFLAKS